MATINWSGRTWVIASGDGYKHPGYVWNPNVPVDANGYLHLNLEKVNGIWNAPMIYDSEATGYGTYQWVLQGIHALDKDAVLGLFPYAWQNAHELDIEQAQWGLATNPTWDFAVQPSTETGQKAIVEFSPAMPNANDIICTIIWASTGESFSMVDAVTGKTLKSWSSSIPVNAQSPAPARTFINLYPRTLPNTGWTQSAPPATDQHYVIKSFTFTPSATDATYDTFLAAALSAEQIPLGQSVTISGTLSTVKSVLQGKNISFVVSNGDLIPSVLTDANGAFTATYKPSAVGTFQVIAHYDGTVP